MTRKSKELMWTAMALTGIGLSALVVSQARGDDAPLKGPQVKQNEGERDRPHGEDQMRPEGERRPEGHARPGDRMRHLLEGIELTDEQREKVRTIMQDGAEKAKAFRDEHKAEFEQLRSDMQAAHEAQDREKMRELAQKHRELMEKGPRSAIIDQIKAVLTSEQLATLEANIAKEREQMRNRQGQPGRPGGEGVSPELREKLEKMSPEEREKFMQEQRERRQQRDGQKHEGDAKGEKLDI